MLEITFNKAAHIGRRQNNAMEISSWSTPEIITKKTLLKNSFSPFRHVITSITSYHTQTPWPQRVLWSGTHTVLQILYSKSCLQTSYSSMFLHSSWQEKWLYACIKYLSAFTLIYSTLSANFYPCKCTALILALLVTDLFSKWLRSSPQIQVLFPVIFLSGYIRTFCSWSRTAKNHKECTLNPLEFNKLQILLLSIKKLLLMS